MDFHIKTKHNMNLNEGLDSKLLSNLESDIYVMEMERKE